MFQRVKILVALETKALLTVFVCPNNKSQSNISILTSNKIHKMEPFSVNEQQVGCGGDGRAKDQA